MFLGPIFEGKMFSPKHVNKKGVRRFCTYFLGEESSLQAPSI